MPSDRRDRLAENEQPSDDLARVEVGRVVGPHGLRGQLRVRLFGDGPGNLMSCSKVWLGDRRDDPNAKAYEVEFVGTGRANEARLGLAGIIDRDASQALRGLLVLASESALEPLADDEFYWHQLVGCEVETETGERVGTVREIWETGAHDVLVVRDEAGRQNLIPTARELTREIDIPGRRIVVAAVPGLIDLGEASETDA
jgi:16S rRNA processing protein RimM